MSHLVRDSRCVILLATTCLFSLATALLALECYANNQEGVLRETMRGTVIACAHLRPFHP